MPHQSLRKQFIVPRRYGNPLNRGEYRLNVSNYSILLFADILQDFKGKWNLLIFTICCVLMNANVLHFARFDDTKNKAIFLQLYSITNKHRICLWCLCFKTNGKNEMLRGYDTFHETSANNWIYTLWTAWHYVPHDLDNREWSPPKKKRRKAG